MHIPFFIKYTIIRNGIAMFESFKYGLSKKDFVFEVPSFYKSTLQHVLSQRFRVVSLCYQLSDALILAKILMICIFTWIACSLFITLDIMRTPSLVKTFAVDFILPQLEVAFCDFKISNSWTVNMDMKSSGNQFTKSNNYGRIVRFRLFFQSQILRSPFI